jgi:hypothetical protein
MLRTIVLLLACALAGCARGEEATGLDADRFVDVVVELRRSAIELRHDPGAYEARKEQVLTDAGVTEAQLREYVERRGTDLDHMAEVWRTINTRMAEADAGVQ